MVQYTPQLAGRSKIRQNAHRKVEIVIMLRAKNRTVIGFLFTGMAIIIQDRGALHCSGFVDGRVWKVKPAL